MKRTNMIIRDESLVKKAKKFSGRKTIVGTFHFVLQRYVNEMEQRERSRKAMEGLSKYFGTGIWEGDLTKMRKSRV